MRLRNLVFLLGLFVVILILLLSCGFIRYMVLFVLVCWLIYYIFRDCWNIYSMFVVLWCYWYCAKILFWMNIRFCRFVWLDLMLCCWLLNVLMIVNCAVCWVVLLIWKWYCLSKFTNWRICCAFWMLVLYWLESTIVICACFRLIWIIFCVYVIRFLMIVCWWVRVGYVFVMMSSVSSWLV